jgi:hypothetical protein
MSLSSDFPLGLLAVPNALLAKQADTLCPTRTNIFGKRSNNGSVYRTSQRAVAEIRARKLLVLERFGFDK